MAEHSPGEEEGARGQVKLPSPVRQRRAAKAGGVSLWAREGKDSHQSPRGQGDRHSRGYHEGEHSRNKAGLALYQVRNILIWAFY